MVPGNGVESILLVPEFDGDEDFEQENKTKQENINANAMETLIK